MVRLKNFEEEDDISYSIDFLDLARYFVLHEFY